VDGSAALEHHRSDILIHVLARTAPRRRSHSPAFSPEPTPPGQRAILIGDDMAQSSPGWLLLSRAGRSFSRERLNQIRLHELLPDFMLHPAIRSTCLDIIKDPRRKRRGIPEESQVAVFA
jgi:hypothetical protein